VTTGDIEAATGASAELFNGNFSGSPVSSVALSVGDNDVYILVTAQNTTTKLYYKVTITREASDNAELTSVLGETISSFGGGNGNATTAPKTATITFAAGSADKTLTNNATDIVQATDATVELYGTGGFGGSTATNVSIPAGETTQVYIKVTAQDGNTELHYKVSIVYPKTVTGYSLKVGETAANNNNTTDATSGVSLASATELDGKVTLKLGGTVTGEYILKAVGTTGSATVTAGSKFENTAGDWLNGAGTKPEAGTYGAVYVKGLVDWADTNAKVLAIKHTSHAIRLYAGNNPDEFLTSSPAKPWIISAISTKVIFMPSSTTELPVKWRLYSAIPKDDTFGILIWDGGANSLTPKTATLEIQEYNAYAGSPGSETTSTAKTDGYSKTVIVDYSAVTFASTATP
ncbi:MAG: hypothetical protein LBB43_00900, partial [Spirochaetaceae bacterium]|nr:hypothetical protein [Spirochaetaceae bacterium]